MENGLLALACMASVLCNASEYHHTNIGPEAFVLRNKENYFRNTWDKHAYLAGINASYEYLEPDNFYFGADWKLCFGKMTVKDFKAERNFDMTFKSIESRLGYNFLVYRDFMLTPYLGMGGRSFRLVSDDKYQPLRMTIDYTYMVQGVKGEFIINDRNRIGLHYRNYFSLTGVSKSNAYYQYINPLNGANEISIPWSFKCRGSGESYVFKFEPYLRKDNMDSAELTFGATLKLSCDF